MNTQASIAADALHALIPAEVRARLRGMRLSTRWPADTPGFGSHPSSLRGGGLEFAQYRAYQQGDDPRHVDWKLYARSDRHYVREAERESPLTAWLLIDASASMAQADAASPSRSRLQVAKALAACTFEIAAQQGDRFGLIALQSDGLQVTPAGQGLRQRDRCLLALHALQAGGQSKPADALRPMWELIRTQHLVIALSDLFDASLTDLLQRLAAARREVAVIGLLTEEERDFPFRGAQLFRDPETGQRLLTDGVGARDDFLARFAQAREALHRQLVLCGIRHVDHVIDQPLIDPLQALFGARRT